MQEGHRRSNPQRISVYRGQGGHMRITIRGDFGSHLSPEQSFRRMLATAVLFDLIAVNAWAAGLWRWARFGHGSLWTLLGVSLMLIASGYWQTTAFQEQRMHLRAQCEDHPTPPRDERATRRTMLTRFIPPLALCLLASICLTLNARWGSSEMVIGVACTLPLAVWWVRLVAAWWRNER